VNKKIKPKSIAKKTPKTPKKTLAKVPKTQKKSQAPVEIPRPVFETESGFGVLVFAG
jgi:hypothetical protein